MPTERQDLQVTNSQQVSLLINEGIASTGQSASVAEVARAIGVSHQALMNLVRGKSDNPRLDTVRGLCAFYNISLDYFDCPTEDACRHYLIEQRQTALLREIALLSARLSPKGQRNVLALIEWVRVGKTAYLAQQQRKRR